jgi:ribonuclease-3
VSHPPIPAHPPHSTALTHSSHSHEQGGEDNERLEFFGDAVLQLLASEILFVALPHAPEGQLTRARKAVVNNEYLASYARSVDLGPKLLMGRGADLDGERDRDRVLAGAIEALIGAAYLDGGVDSARAWVEAIVAFGETDEGAAAHPKNELQQWAESQHGTVPTYTLLGVSGADHKPTHEVQVQVGEHVQATGMGSTKKAASVEAARAALRKLEG